MLEWKKTLILKVKPKKCQLCFLGKITEKPQSTILTLFQKSAPGSKHHKKINLLFLVHRSVRNRWQTFWKKINEFGKINGIVGKLDAHYGFLLKNCFSLPKLLYFLRTSTCSNTPPLLEKNDKTVRDGISKVYNVSF